MNETKKRGCIRTDATNCKVEVYDSASIWNHNSGSEECISQSGTSATCVVSTTRIYY